ncbi:MAG: hypothetical protein AB1Z57_05650 [Acidimicrobiia bacterium]
MDPSPGHRLSDGGLASVQFVIAAALALLATVWLADALVVRYAQGVMGVAAREGARAASVASDPGPACREEAAAWLADGLGGSMGDRVTVACRGRAGIVEVTVSGVFDAWMPGVPDWSVRRVATAALEP